MTAVMLIYLFPYRHLERHSMRIPCEVAAKSVVPAIRALLAIELIETHRVKQREVAEMLGITQTAISKYSHRVRGRILSIEEDEVRMLIANTADSLASGAMTRTDLVKQICATCRLVREKRLMCKVCKRMNPELDVEHCELCSFSFSKSSRQRVSRRRQ
jgi:predicted transcriptional regulator